MSSSKHGTKYVCQECATRYYDLNKPSIACPKCGAKPLAAPATLPERPVGRTMRESFPRYSKR